MIDTIEKAFNPFHLVICFVGFGIFRHNVDDTIPRLNIFYILTVWSIYAFAFHYMVTLFEPYRIFTGFVIFFIVLTNLFVTILSVISNTRKHKKIIMCVRNLSLVDDTLEQLGTPKEYCKMRNLMKWILIIWFTAICTTWTIDSFWYIERIQDIRAIIVPIIVNYPFHVNTFMDIVFMFLLRYIGTRFDKINDYIGQLSEIEEYGLRCTWKKSLVTRYYVRNTESREHVLWTTMHLHLELCRIARNINDFFGMQITLQMMSYFVLLTGVLYFEYYTVLCFMQDYNGNKNKLIFLMYTNIWCSIYLTKLITLNYICENVSIKAEKTKNMIHNLANLICFVEIREDICQFLLQISLRPLKFDGMGLFYFGYTFIRKFIIAIISVLIFMVQMDSSPLSRVLVASRSNATCYK